MAVVQHKPIGFVGADTQQDPADGKSMAQLLAPDWDILYASEPDSVR